ncbi:MAG: oxidoreductase [Oceanospirillales bacterium]|nr:MAG: oxidoreductase [Oceanospirillales bacterium]
MNKHSRSWVLTTVLFLSILICPKLFAQSPEGQPVLTMSGKIAVTNQGDTWVFDRAMLEALPQGKIITETPWYDEVSEFEGPLASAILEAVGADFSDNLRVIALNDYSAVVPASDFIDHGVILAMKINGEVLRVRDKGPLFLIYPFDSDPALKTEVYYNRSVWQIKAIEIY